MGDIPFKEPIPLEPISRWVYTAAAQSVPCPKCTAMPGFHCRTPSGVYAQFPHLERCSRYKSSISEATFKERHCAKAVSLLDIIFTPTKTTNDNNSDTK